MFDVRLAAPSVLVILGVAACAGTNSKEPDMNSGKSKDSSTADVLGELAEETRSVDSKMRIPNERTLESAAPGDIHAVIIRVTRENYVPDGIEPTVVVTPYMFTTRITTEELSALENDENVSAVEISSRLKE